MGFILVMMILIVLIVIFIEVFLSYLGFGVLVLLVSWGMMVFDGLFVLIYYLWCLFFFVGFICIMMFGFNVVGDGLRDVLDFKLCK